MAHLADRLVQRLSVSQACNNGKPKQCLVHKLYDLHWLVACERECYLCWSGKRLGFFSSAPTPANHLKQLVGLPLNPRVPQAQSFIETVIIELSKTTAAAIAAEAEVASLAILASAKLPCDETIVDLIGLE